LELWLPFSALSRLLSPPQLQDRGAGHHGREQGI
jgi:hypothetical protein